MALSSIIKHIYTLGTDEVIKRGKKIYTSGYAELVEHDELFGSATFRIKDDTYATNYKVYVHKFKDLKGPQLRCTCPYDAGEICRHKVASLFQLQDLLDRGALANAGIQYDQRHTVAKMKNIEFKILRQLSSQDIIHQAQDYLQSNVVEIVQAKDETIKANVSLDGVIYSVIIKKNEERNFDTSSNYIDKEHLLCLPKIIVFLHLLEKKGTAFFDTIRNWDKEKNKLLEIYGYSLSDSLKGKFEFAYKDGKPFLRVLDASIKKIAPIVTPAKTSFIITPEPGPVNTTIAPLTKAVPIAAEKAGLVIRFNNDVYPFFTLQIVTGIINQLQDRFVDKVTVPDLNKYIDIESLSAQDAGLITLARKLQPTELEKYIQKNIPFFEKEEPLAIQTNGQTLPIETKELINEFLFPRLKNIIENNSEKLLAYTLTSNKKLITENLEKIEFSDKEAIPFFTIKKEQNYIIQCQVKVSGISYNLVGNESNSPLFYLYNNQLFFWKNYEVIKLIEKFLPSGEMIITEENWTTAIQELILPLSSEYQINFEKKLVKEIKNAPVEIKVLLIEKGEYLIFQPEFSYNGFTAKQNELEKFLVATNQQIIKIHKNKEAENTFTETLKAQHSNFIYNEENGSLALKGTEVLKNNWFFLFVDAMKEMKIPVFGFEALKNFRFNTSKPQTKIFISSNTDWFDAKVDIHFGSQKVTVADVKKALANKQQFVQLSDGTLGILPEEWIKKYALLFRVGDGNNNHLKLSHYHVNIVDELYENRNEEELVLQLENKYETLKEFNKIEEITPPDYLQSILRPYQVAGFQWLNYLRKINWGGILADDMGLGKTLQALTYLLHHKTQNGTLKALVVCPTTLIYNWENEIKKFTPALSHYIHHGPDRIRAVEELAQKDITITTYGTLRSDIKLFLKHKFDYAILDESQAIKNPASKVTKAACLLHVQHKLCMSGTPLQNNTFDVYAQMNFLNPGLLGTQEFFRQEFAIPIDKQGEQDRKEHLRKILYPFILRRTKEQVAKDLPEKQEMILWCEMEEEQRKIYDAYRNDFRDKILGTIQEYGIQKSQLNILQGLMKLRQICDSPYILNEEEKFENHSIKIDELARELIENISNHKTLIFSQFLGMLALIKEKLKELQISFEYFDGNTTAPDREKAIQSFQNNDEVRVFLISLKAGGVGLNLTAADYVYIVDPWWNPAVEQQAIDRTHRIGQTKNIFAYRMICKDTIEDKILILQEKKRNLAKELIADDSSFVKSLSKEDVEYLFS